MADSERSGSDVKRPGYISRQVRPLPSKEKEVELKRLGENRVPHEVVTPIGLLDPNIRPATEVTESKPSATGIGAIGLSGQPGPARAVGDFMRQLKSPMEDVPTGEISFDTTQTLHGGQGPGDTGFLGDAFDLLGVGAANALGGGLPATIGKRTLGAFGANVVAQDIRKRMTGKFTGGSENWANALKFSAKEALFGYGAERVVGFGKNIGFGALNYVRGKNPLIPKLFPELNKGFGPIDAGYNSQPVRWLLSIVEAEQKANAVQWAIRNPFAEFKLFTAKNLNGQAKWSLGQRGAVVESFGKNVQKFKDYSQGFSAELQNKITSIAGKAGIKQDVPLLGTVVAPIDGAALKAYATKSRNNILRNYPHFRGKEFAVEKSAKQLKKMSSNDLTQDITRYNSQIRQLRDMDASQATIDKVAKKAEKAEAQLAKNIALEQDLKNIAQQPKILQDAIKRVYDIHDDILIKLGNGTDGLNLNEMILYRKELSALAASDMYATHMSVREAVDGAIKAVDKSVYSSFDTMPAWHPTRTGMQRTVNDAKVGSATSEVRRLYTDIINQSDQYAKFIQGEPLFREVVEAQRKMPQTEMDNILKDAGAVDTFARDATPEIKRNLAAYHWTTLMEDKRIWTEGVDLTKANASVDGKALWAKWMDPDEQQIKNALYTANERKSIDKFIKFVVNSADQPDSSLIRTGITNLIRGSFILAGGLITGSPSQNTAAFLAGSSMAYLGGSLIAKKVLMNDKVARAFIGVSSGTVNPVYVRTLASAIGTEKAVWEANGKHVSGTFNEFMEFIGIKEPEDED
jgi:hypothetical protein